LLKLLYLDLNRRAASHSTYTSQSSNASACCASKLRECVLLLGGADTMRERPRVRVHAAAGLMALLAV
jgi:hypothetical protein